jgi:hypothetical protein
MAKVTARKSSGDHLLLTAEHAGNRIPREHAPLFRDAGQVLQSHRGWDPGSLEIGRALSRELGAPLLTVDWSRLLVESNRSPNNPRIWSEFTAGLPVAERQQILDRYWWPHRNEVLARTTKTTFGSPAACATTPRGFKWSVLIQIPANAFACSIRAANHGRIILHGARTGHVSWARLRADAPQSLHCS